MTQLPSELAKRLHIDLSAPGASATFGNAVYRLNHYLANNMQKILKYNWIRRNSYIWTESYVYEMTWKYFIQWARGDFDQGGSTKAHLNHKSADIWHDRDGKNSVWQGFTDWARQSESECPGAPHWLLTWTPEQDAYWSKHVREKEESIKRLELESKLAPRIRFWQRINEEDGNGWPKSYIVALAERALALSDGEESIRTTAKEKGLGEAYISQELQALSEKWTFPDVEPYLEREREAKANEPEFAFLDDPLMAGMNPLNQMEVVK